MLFQVYILILFENSLFFPLAKPEFSNQTSIIPGIVLIHRSTPRVAGVAGFVVGGGAMLFVIF